MAAAAGDKQGAQRFRWLRARDRQRRQNGTEQNELSETHNFVVSSRRDKSPKLQTFSGTT